MSESNPKVEELLLLEEESCSREQITRSEALLLRKIRRIDRERKAWVAAASVVILAAGAMGIYTMQRGRQPEWHTAYGEVKTSSFPDGTEVMVNADTRIRYSSGWTDGKDREVWLSGEAFFHVRKTPLKSRFIVHADHFDVIVTGTQFNVTSRGEKANVLLQEGSVLLHTEGGEEIAMTPGDFVEYGHDHLTKRMVKTDSVTAWKEHKLSFDNTSLKDVAAIIKEQYGVTVRLEGAEVGEKTVSGIMPNNNLDVLLKALEATTEFKIVRRDDEISIIQN